MIAAKRILCSTSPKRPGRYPLAARRSRLAVHRQQDQGTRGYSGTAETWAQPHTDVTVAAGGAVAPAGAVVRTPAHGRARPPPLKDRRRDHNPRVGGSSPSSATNFVISYQTLTPVNR